MHEGKTARSKSQLAQISVDPYLHIGRILQDIRHFLDVDFEPSEEETSHFDRVAPEEYPYRYTSIYFENSVLRLVTVESPYTWKSGCPNVRRFAYLPVDCLILDMNMLSSNWFTSQSLVSVRWEGLLQSLQRALDVKDVEIESSLQHLRMIKNYGILNTGNYGMGKDAPTPGYAPPNLEIAPLDERIKFGPLDPDSNLGLQELRKALMSVIAEVADRKRRQDMFPEGLETS